MAKSRHTTLLIPPEERARLEEIARHLGYVQSRGVGAGAIGSISALMCAIARGDYVVVHGKRKQPDGQAIEAGLERRGPAQAEAAEK